ncbi:MAG: DUF2207 domain-containing protein [Propionibacteriaceae bacterium]|nr:DUF2207 domain-containing protein [Propionibacteriaceae bacterium]
MKRAVYALVASLIVTLSCVVAGAGAPMAQAAAGDSITSMTAQVAVDASGVATVHQTFVVSYATTGHGPYIWFQTRQAYNSSNDRLITYSNITVSSSTGAPDQVQTTVEPTYTQLRIGDPNRLVSGSQSYEVSYTVSGIINPDVAASGMDELYWNILGTAWTLPISDISVSIQGPAPLAKTTCYTGSDYTDPCTTTSSSGATATYTQTSLQPGQGLAVAGGWPAGTFSGVTLDLVSSNRNPFDLTHGGAIPAGAALVLSVVAVFVVLRMRRAGRDEQYANVTPGSLPAPGDAEVVTRAEVKDAAVEFAPPAGVPPRLVGAIVREGTANEDITASIVDLAVRGYIHMNDDGHGGFSLQRTNADPATLTPVDKRIYSDLFARNAVMTTQDMSSEKFYPTYTGFQTLIQEEFTAQKWYRANPQTIMRLFRLAGLVVMAAGVGVGFIGFQLAQSGSVGISWLGVPLLVFGVGLWLVAKRMPVRTPLGSAVAVLSLGFHKYLATAEADQIRWEEGQDIFSQYLPYAISFGLAERWAKIFEELVAKGAPVPQPVWFTGYPGYNFAVWTAINHSIGSIGTSMTSAVSQYAAAQAHATMGSSGGSAFFGGGGGGGIGGGGGGTW